MASGQALYRQQLPALRVYACSDYLYHGLDLLDLPQDHILDRSLPSISASHPAPAGGWSAPWCVTLSAVPWYHKFNQRIFLVTDYMRQPRRAGLDAGAGYVPRYLRSPALHDPIKHYTELQEMFAPAFLADDPW